MYGILRANKIKLNNVTKRFQKHIQRQSNYYHSNPDIDLAKQSEDVIFIFSKDFKKSIYEELEKHNITKQPRKNAVGIIDGIITASSGFFDKKDKNSIIDFFKESLPIIKREYGPIISAVIHFDEKTPHLHFCTTPILKNSEGNYKLSAKEVMGNKKEYIAKQDRFYEEYFKNYGLQRGQSVKETSRNHIEHNRYKAQQAQENFIKAVTATNSQKQLNQNLITQQAELEKQLSEEKDIHDKIQTELLAMANDSQLYRELLKRSILDGNYNDIDDFKQRVMDCEEAAQIWEYMQDLYSEFKEPFQDIEDEDMGW